MANYTLTLKQLIENEVEIFDFDYELFDETYKPTFEQLFKDYFIMDEICCETVAYWKLLLKNKLQMSLPYYNKLYYSQNLEQRVLDNYDVTEEYTREVDTTVANSNTSTNRNLYKDAPKTKVDINDFDVVTNLSKNIGDSNSNTTGNNREHWKRTMQGNIGVQTDADAVVKYEQSLRNVTLQLFENELTTLFMGVY